MCVARAIHGPTLPGRASHRVLRVACVPAPAGGEAKIDDKPEWHLFNAQSYKQMRNGGSMSTEIGQANADDGRTILNGLVRTVYLQCGAAEENLQHGKQHRFYDSLSEWLTNNPEPTVEKPLGPVIHT